MLAAPGLRDQVDRLGGAAGEDDVVARRRAEEIRDLGPGVLVGVGRPRRQACAPRGARWSSRARRSTPSRSMTACGFCVVAALSSHTSWLPVDPLAEDRELPADGTDVKRRRGADGERRVRHCGRRQLIDEIEARCARLADAWRRELRPGTLWLAGGQVRRRDGRLVVRRRGSWQLIGPRGRGWLVARERGEELVGQPGQHRLVRQPRRHGAHGVTGRHGRIHGTCQPQRPPGLRARPG